MSLINICFLIKKDKINDFSKIEDIKQINSSNSPFQFINSSTISDLDEKIRQRAGNTLGRLIYCLTGPGKSFESFNVFLDVEIIDAELTPMTTEKGKIYELTINILNQDPVLVAINQDTAKSLMGEPVLITGSTKAEIFPIENPKHVDCFMNAIFQVIMHDDLLKTALLQTYQNENSSKSKALCQAIQDYSEGKTITTTALREFMPVGFQQGQQDACEFLQSLLKDVTYKNYPDLFATQKLTYNWEIKGWFGSVNETMKRETSSPHYFIPLEITSCSGKDLIDLYFTKKIHVGENLKDNGKTYTPGQVQVEIMGTPKRLVFQLKRFDTSHKIQSLVEMPKKIQINGSDYALKKIVMHHGPLKGEGHYTSLLQDDNNMWTKADDKTISKDQDSTEYRKKGYLYFYEKSAF